jgi:hypothetical protein
MNSVRSKRLLLGLLGLIGIAALIIAFLPARGKLSRPSPPNTAFPTSSQLSALLLTVSSLELEGGDDGFASPDAFRAAVAETTRELSVAKTLEPWEVFINPDRSAWLATNTSKAPAIVCRHLKGRGVFVMTFGHTWFITPEQWVEAPWLDQAIRPE